MRSSAPVALDTLGTLPETALAVRVIAGSLGGRRLAAPGGRHTRPTSDRVREALFMALEPWEGRRVVDLYAGSGALGIEALSRGAARADFAESGRDALQALEENLERLELRDRATIWRVGLPHGVHRMREPLAAADVVLLDPPYGGAEARAALETLGEPGVLRAGCRVVLEHHAKDEVPESAGALHRTGARRYGETHITFYEPRGSGSHGSGEPRA